jgi:hypothetical protein
MGILIYSNNVILKNGPIMDDGRKARAAKTRLTRGAARRGESSDLKKINPALSAEMILDEAVELTFPASDPVSVEHAFMSASRRARNIGNTHKPGTGEKTTQSSPSRKKI